MEIKRLSLIFIPILLGLILYNYIGWNNKIKNSPISIKTLTPDNRYDWLFNESTLKDLKCVKASGESDNFLYSFGTPEARIIIWEIKNLGSTKIEHYFISNTAQFVETEFNQKTYGEATYYMGPRLSLNAKHILTFTKNQTLRVTGNTLNKVKSSSNDYLYFSGEYRNISILNKSDECQINLSYENFTPTEFLLLIKDGSAYIIVQNSLEENKELQTKLPELLSFTID